MSKIDDFGVTMRIANIGINRTRGGRSTALEFVPKFLGMIDPTKLEEALYRLPEGKGSLASGVDLGPIIQEWRGKMITLDPNGLSMTGQQLVKTKPNDNKVA